MEEIRITTNIKERETQSKRNLILIYNKLIGKRSNSNKKEQPVETEYNKIRRTNELNRIKKNKA
jgi:hypothetical protein